MKEKWTNAKLVEMDRIYRGYLMQGGTLEKLKEIHPNITPIEIELWMSITGGKQ